MQYRTLGSSGLLVSPICLGTMTFGTPVAETDAIRLVHEAIDRGVNFIDTANAYEGYNRVVGSPGGVAEEICGKALRDRRDDVVLATKVANAVAPGPQGRGLSATHMLRELDRSLKRLQTDYIDLYIIHMPDKEVPLENTLATMDQAVRSGRVRYFGVSNHSAAQICELLWIADKRSGPPVVSSQIPFSLLHRHLQNELDFCAQHAVGVTPYQVLQGGLLTGKYRRDQAPPAGSRADEKPGWVWERDSAMYDRLEAIEGIAKEVGVSMSHLTLAWTLAQPAISSLVVGAKRIGQVEDALAALEVTLPAEAMAKIDEICPPPWKMMDPVRG